MAKTDFLDPLAHDALMTILANPAHYDKAWRESSYPHEYFAQFAARLAYALAKEMLTARKCIIKEME